MSLPRLVKSLLITLLAPMAALPLAGCPSGDDDDSAVDEGPVVVAGIGAFDTIQDALDAAPECGTITIGAGIYDERLRIRQCVTLVGAGQDRVRVTGGGAGTIVDIDQVGGPVLLSGFQIYGPFAEAGTIRGVRVTSSGDVTLNDLFIGFEPGPAGEVDRGNVGVDISQSTVVIDSTDIVRVGFGSEVGGTCVLAQTSSDLTVDGSRIEGGGSFGIHAVGGRLYIKDTDVIATNRSTGAQQFEADGSGIWAEDFSQAVTLDNVTVQNGSFVGAWMDAPTVTVNGGSFANYAYGVYLPGDPASAAGRQLNITGATFTDLVQVGVLSVASATITGSTFQLSEDVIPDPNGGRPYGAVRVVAPGGTVDVSSNVVVGTGSSDAIRVLGSATDGPVATVNINGNTVQDIVAGNGIQVVEADEVVIEDNIVDGIDHGYWQDAANPANDGLIINGFGVACFQVDSCTTRNNAVSGAEFANLVIVNSVFSSTDDVLEESVWQGIQVEGSQGTFSNLSLLGGEGTGATFIDSTVSIDASNISGFMRGANFRDFDDLDDPLPQDILRLNGGQAIQSYSQGNPAWLYVTDSTFADNVANALVSQDSQLIFTGNTLTNNGFEFDDGSGIILGPGSAIQVFRGASNALQGPLIQNNVIDGNAGAWAVQINGATRARFLDNIVCGGDSAGLFFSGNDGGVVRGNQLGASSDATVTSCDALLWTYQLYLAGSDATTITQVVEVSDNVLGNVGAQYGIFMSALGAFEINDNEITGGSVAGIRMSATLPSGLTSDNDGDGVAEYLGDCDDDNPAVWWNRSSQTGALDDPNAPDGVDNDCDGVADDGLDTTDADNDGVTIADGDCDDTDPAVAPGLEEIVGNLKDDNCDSFGWNLDRPSRWADFDGAMPVPEVVMEGNSILATGTGLDIDGGNVELSDGPQGNNPNVIDGTTGVGVVVDDWMWSSSTPEMAPGSLTVADGTVLANIGGDCFVVQGEGTELTLGAVLLDACGGSGVSMFAAGTVTATGTTITDPGDAGVEIGAGSALLADVSIAGAGADGVYVQGGSLSASNVTIADSTDDGLAVAIVGDATLLGGTISGSLGNAVELQSGTADLQGVTISSSGLQSVLASGGTLRVSGGTITGGSVGIQISGVGSVTLTDAAVVGATGAGVAIAAGSLVVDGGAISGSGGDGITATGTAALDVLDGDVSDSLGYGMSCGAQVTSTACTVTMTNNALGDLDGCGFCTVQ